MFTVKQYLKWRMEMNTPIQKKGELKEYWGKYGGVRQKFFDCEDCGMTFPAENREDFEGHGRYEGKAMCNGASIDLCPYCRIDSREGAYGR